MPWFMKCTIPTDSENIDLYGLDTTQQLQQSLTAKSVDEEYGLEDPMYDFE